MRNMFFTASMNRFMPVSRLSYNFERTTCLGNLFLCRLAERLRVNRQLGRQLAIAENLDGARSAANKTVRPEHLWRNLFARRENVQFRQLHIPQLPANRLITAALSHPP